MLPEPTTSQTIKRLPLSINIDLFLKVVPGLFMIAFLIMGALSVLTRPVTYEMQGGSWLNGEAALAYEAHFNESLPLRQAYIDTWGIIEYSLFNQANDGVLVGSDGWLFTSEEFAYYPDEAAAISEKITLISKFKEVLAAQDIDLVITLVPSKTSIYPEHLGRYNVPDYVTTRYDRELEAIEAAGIDVIDLRPALFDVKQEGLGYFKTDTHWTPLGAAAAAKEIARALQEKGYELPFGSNSFVTNPADSLTQHEGDLIPFIPLGVLKEQLAPAREPLQEVVTVQTNVGLFADTSTPVTLVGTSYSGDSRWNFAGALKEALGMHVLNAGLVGQGEVVPMEAYLASENPVENKPELVIWQLSERGFPMTAEAEADSALTANAAMTEAK